jgi:hypothetical protein
VKPFLIRALRHQVPIRYGSVFRIAISVSALTSDFQGSQIIPPLCNQQVVGSIPTAGSSQNRGVWHQIF